MQVVLSTVSPEAAENLAFKLIELRLAACVNVVRGVTSIYRWEGAVQHESESLLVIKTSDDTLPRLMRELPELHPYDTPEIVAVQPSSVHAPYADWVHIESTPVQGD